jgi:hypothetical protein
MDERHEHETSRQAQIGPQGSPPRNIARATSSSIRSANFTYVALRDMSFSFEMFGFRDERRWHANADCAIKLLSLRF